MRVWKLVCGDDSRWSGSLVRMDLNFDCPVVLLHECVDLDVNIVESHISGFIGLRIARVDEDSLAVIVRTSELALQFTEIYESVSTLS